MKKILVILLLSASIPVFASDSLTSKIVEKFNTTFPHAKNVRWHQNEDNTEVYYNTAGIQCHVWYDLGGEIIKSRRYYSQKDLSPYMQAKIGQQFPGKTIFGVTEISEAGDVLYTIVLQDAKHWLHVQGDASGDMVVTQKYKKSK